MRYDPEKITFFAQTDARGQQMPFGIKAKDRARHMYVIGKTGMGKSTMLENMAVQDIQNGEGIAFIDPHGSTAEKLLSYVPEERIKDVVYFAPFDMNYPISFNVMEDVGPDRRHLVVSGLMSTFKKIWVDAWSARMEYILTKTLLALLEYPDSTLLSVSQMLADKSYRRKVVDNIKDPAVRSFWVDEFANYTDRFAAEATPAIQNKIGQFTGNPLIRNIVGQPKSSFDIREIMDNQKILIMNLSKGLVGETNANLLGSMLTTRIYLAAMSRADLSQQAMKAAPNFYFYVDEFQSFANSTFADILSEARKYKLNLTIAHQYIEQMEEEVRNAVFGNVGTTIAFRVGPFDAEVLETVYTPKFTANDLVNLGFAQIYLTLMIDGIGSQPFSATTLPPIEEPHISYKEMVITESRKQFAYNRVDVEKIIAKTMVSEQAELSNARIAREKEKQKQYQERQAHSENGNREHATGDRPNTQHRKRFDDGGRPDARDRRPDRRARDEQPQRSKRPDAAGQQRPRQSKGKDLTELRSILKDISGGDETEKKRAPEEGNGRTDASRQKPQQKKEASPGTESLRDILGKMQKEVKSKPAAQGDVQSAKKDPETTTQTTHESQSKQAVPKHDRVEKKVPRPTHGKAVTPPRKHNQEEKPAVLRDAEHAKKPNLPTSVRPATPQKPQAKRERPQEASPVVPEAPPPVPQQPASKQAVAPAVSKAQNQSSDHISPKALDRMMRVSGSDKTPFR